MNTSDFPEFPHSVAGTRPGRFLRRVPDRIYHYCGIEAFRKIVTGKAMRLSSSIHMNDATEISVFTDNLKRMAKSEDNQEILKFLECKPSAEPYLACFSSNGDLLSQWRAYGGDGTGLAIGLNTNLMDVDAGGENQARTVYSPLGIWLQPVAYGDEWSSDFYQRLVAEMEEGPIDQKRAVYLFHLMDYYSCFEKSKYFSEEDESRIAHFPLLALSENSPRQVVIGEIFEGRGITGPFYRESRGRLAPYFQYDLRKAVGAFAKANRVEGHENLTPVCEVVLGPRCRMTIEEVQHFLDNAHFSVGERRHEIEVRKSSGSYT